MDIRKPKKGQGIVDVEAGTTQASGKTAENLAADYLTKHDVKIIARNIRSRGGEIDLIGLDRHQLLFIEVRLRRHTAFGGPAHSITAAKRQRIRLTAQYWLSTQGQRYSRHPCRFDALLLTSLNPLQIDWIQAAFDT